MEVPKVKKKSKKAQELFSVFLYGESYVGKTNLLSKIKGILHMSTDMNVDDMEVDSINLLKEEEVSYFELGGGQRVERKDFAKKWQKFKAYALAFDDPKYKEELKKAGYTTIAVDVLDHIYDWCREYHLEDQGFRTESESPFFRVRTDIREDFRDTVLKMLESLRTDFNVIFTGFSAQEKYQELTETKIRIVPNLKILNANSDGTAKEGFMVRFASKVDATILLQRNAEGQRALIANNGDVNYQTGNRFRWEGYIEPQHLIDMMNKKIIEKIVE